MLENLQQKVDIKGEERGNFSRNMIPIIFKINNQKEYKYISSREGNISICINLEWRDTSIFPCQRGDRQVCHFLHKIRAYQHWASSAIAWPTVCAGNIWTSSYRPVGTGVRRPKQQCSSSIAMSHKLSLIFCQCLWKLWHANLLAYKQSKIKSRIFSQFLT